VRPEQERRLLPNLQEKKRQQQIQGTMVTTRRRARLQGEGNVDDVEKPEDANNKKAPPENEADDDNVEEAPTSSKSSNKKEKITRREIRKHQRETLRSKNLGLIHIGDTNDGTETPTSSNRPRKIVFDDTNDVSLEDNGDKEQDLVDDKLGDNQRIQDDDDGDDDDDDDDDAVEQMDSKAAKDMMLAQREQERNTSKAFRATPRKRKRTTGSRGTEHEKDVGPLEDDDDFFAELEAQKAAERKKRKAAAGGDVDVIPKHTIFQTANEELTSKATLEVHPGLELVVLGEKDHDDEGDDGYQQFEKEQAMSLAVTGELSRTALQHSRGFLKGGWDVISDKQRKKKNKTGLMATKDTWKRSKKMNRLLLTKGKGKAAVNFASKKVTPTFKF